MTQYPPPPYGPPPPPSMSPADEKMWATLIHLGGLFFGFIAPLIGYLVLKDRGPFVRAHTATALNFQLTLLIVYVAGYILTFVIVGIFVLIAAGILALVFSIIAAVKANQGQWYQYPMTIRFVS
ncbi:putative Tic20 family protein [Microbacterium thalassium]|uniref:Putative Tic20 family protein n=2 Tax=Microbacterium thalassium TaxID=362649 RepID=A0A7X0KU50_9MICO|nr:putative Tic20 family protein [Microbacterium thalassium]